jgi:hypothetical protein
LNDALYCLRFLLMILLLVEMMNQSLGTCPNFGVHFTDLLFFALFCGNKNMSVNVIR